MVCQLYNYPNLDNEEYLTRSVAATGLRNILNRKDDEEVAIQLLKAKVEEGDDNSKVRVINAVGTIPHTAVVELLISKLYDETSAVKEAARKALSSQAINTFLSGDVTKAADLFEAAVSVESTSELSDELRNNYAYVLILLKQYEEAATQFASMTFSIRDSDWPLLRHNYGLVAYFMGDVDKATSSLREALDWIRDADLGYDPRHAICMLVIDGEVATSHRDLPVDAAILLNLYKMGDLKEEELRAELSLRYPTEAEGWLIKFH